MDKKMVLNEKEYEILKLLGKGKAGILIWQVTERRGMFSSRFTMNPVDITSLGIRLKQN